MQPQARAFKLPKEITARLLISLLFMVMVPCFSAVADHIAFSAIPQRPHAQPFLQT